jgi:carboxymethylenebutenolidase
VNRSIIYILVVLIIIAVIFIYIGNKNNVGDFTTGDIKNSEILSINGDYEIKTAEVNYFENIKGFFAEPVEKGNYPGVVMIHEWWGLNDNIRDTAKNLAKNGYKVLAVDLFGRVATTADEARSQTSALNQDKATQNLRAAVGYLRDKGSTKMASLGWCFGGG